MLKKKGNGSMKNFIKKTAATTLSVFGILSAMPSAFCAPDGENNLPVNNERGHIDPFHIMIVGKYFDSVKDFQNLAMANKKYGDLTKKYYFNPVKISSKDQYKMFPSLVTYRVGENGENFVDTFPNDNVKTMLYLPGSFNITNFKRVLESNKIEGYFKDSLLDWHSDVELNDDNPMNGCRLIFTHGDRKIIFVFDPSSDGSLVELKRYNAFLSSCGADKGMIPLSDDVSISKNFKGVGNSAFYGCTSLKNVKISDGVKNIGDGAFYYCNGLKNINIPDSIENIGEFAFYNCSSLKAIKIPNSVKYINNTAFAGCSSLNHIEFNGNVYDSVGNFMAAFNAYRASQK